MCRSCRYKKCLQRGMLTSAVQNVQDDGGSDEKNNFTLPGIVSPNSAFEMNPNTKLQHLNTFYMGRHYFLPFKEYFWNKI